MSFILRAAIGLGSVAALSASANATLFSFASDTNQLGPTFLGSAGTGSSFTITDAGPSNRFLFKIDDNNGPLNFFSQTVRFEANIEATWVASPLIFGTTFQHIYSIANGPAGAFVFRFSDPSDNSVLLTASLDGSLSGVFSVPGTASSWSTTGAVLGSDAFANVRYVATQALVDKMNNAGFNAESYGVRAGESIGPDDFGFDLSVLFQRGSTLGVNLNQDTRTPTTGWESEGSFSGSAFNGFVPTPSAGSLLVLAGIVSTRRRRA